MKKINLNLKEKGKKVVNFTGEHLDVVVAAVGVGCTVAFTVASINYVKEYCRVNEKALSDALEKLVDQ